MEQMPLYFRTAPDKPVAAAPPSAVIPRGKRKFHPQVIAELLERHHGNRTYVAQELGVDRTTLWRWMNRHGMNGSVGGNYA